MEKIGIIGGSGLYEIEGLENEEWVKVKTPFGEPSDRFLVARLEGREIVFLPRHGVNHHVSPSKINYRANIFGMKSLGVGQIISVTACGSLKEEYKPKDFVIPDQFLDRTNGRVNSFFGEHIVAHVSFAYPICDTLAASVYGSIEKEGISVHRGGTYVNIEGPQFSTFAESILYRSWGMDIIGMTNMTEARLAKEAEMCYVTIAAVTDYDCWRQTEEEVSVEAIMENLKQNVNNSKKIIKRVVADAPHKRTCGCSEALQYAIVTKRSALSTEVKKKLKVLIGKYIS